MITADVKHPRLLEESEIEAWRAACAAEPAFANPLLGPDFAQLVGQAREDARAAVFRRDGRMAGFIAFHCRGGVAQPIGAAFSDYQALVTVPGERLDGAEALGAAGVSGLRLTGLIDPFDAFPSARPSAMQGFVIEPLPDADAYYAALREANPKRFKNWRRLQNKLEREWGEVVACPTETSPEVLDQLIEWKRDQFRRTGSHDVLRPEWARALFHRILEARGHARPVMAALRAGGVLVAGHFGLAVGPHAHGWLSVINPDSAAAGPGQVLAFRTAEFLPGLGLRSYDLSPGYAHYKAPFASRTVEVREGLVTASGRAGAAARSLNAVWALAGEQRFDAVGRLRRRLDHIAAAELSAGGRARGVVEAIAGYGRRAASREPTQSEA